MKDLVTDSDDIVILGIESSCDETGVALYSSKRGLLAHQLKSQVDLHAIYGGVVPELAARDHAHILLPLVEETLKNAQLSPHDLSAIAYTAGPGLVGALMVGGAFAVSLGFALHIPVIPVHHMEAHLLAPLLEEHKPTFPFIALLVSGGHTQLYLSNSIGHYELLGESVDDAVGEAFDKTAKLLGLPYPGGPRLAALAETVTQSSYSFSRPMMKEKHLNFSFSGLKTQVLQAWKKSNQTPQDKAEIAFAFQEAAIDVLIHKATQALKNNGIETLVVAGGVSANQHLRKLLAEKATREQFKVFFPQIAFSTDNGAMVAFAGFVNYQKRVKAETIIAVPRWPLAS